MTNYDFLENAEVFKGLDKDQLAAIQPCCVEKEYLYGRKLFAEGEAGKHLWVMMEGQVDLRFELPDRSSSEKFTIATMTAGDAFGWSSFVQPFKYGFSAYCASKNCKLLQVDSHCLQEIFEKDVKAGYRIVFNLAAVVGKRFQQLHDTYHALPVAISEITVHLATCGIAAGARSVMDALLEEVSKVERPDIKVATSGCIGKCNTEPNVTITIESRKPVVYQKMTPEKMRRVFQDHILKGEVQSEWVLNQTEK
jgi:NADP-reducing hydrogenase subunit HndB